MNIIRTLSLALVAFTSTLSAAGAPKPIKALLITGGAAHDYTKQKDILKKGIEERANVTVEFLHSDDKTMKPVLPFLEKPEPRKRHL